MKDKKQEKRDFFLHFELQVWEALKNGDPEADAALLAEHFVGVYETGVSDKEAHCNQLRNGPIVTSYEILQPSLLKVSSDAYMLSYLAKWTAPGSSKLQKMFVSSLWQKIDGEWKNTFSQDTPVKDE